MDGRMFARLLRLLSRAGADAAFALGTGLKGALRPSVLVRSALVSIAATLLTLWLFRYHWDLAQYFAAAFVPLLLVGAHTAATSAAAPTSSLSMFDPVNGSIDLIHGLGAAAHIVLALALAVVCGFILCGLLLSLAGIRLWLLPGVERRALAKYPALHRAVAMPTEAPWQRLFRFALALLGFLLASQLIYVAAMLVPHLAILWFLLLAYLPASHIAGRSLQTLAPHAVRSRLLRSHSAGLLLFGLMTLVIAVIPVINLLAPAVLCIGSVRLGYRSLAEDVRAVASGEE
jgi:uncharacterized protein involved in cysteine biosynthesis